MQLRELLKNQQILTPNVSAKSANQYVEWDAFSDILNKKSIQPESKVTYNKPLKKEIGTDTFDKPDNQFSVKVNVNVKTRETTEPLVNETRQENKVDTKDDKSNQNVKKTDDDEPNVKDKSKLKSTLKSKLKEMTGLDETKLEALLSTMDLSIEDMEKLMVNLEDVAKVMSTLTDLLEGLEIDQALENSVSKVEMVQISSKLNQLIQTLEKMQSSDQTQNSNEVKSEGNAFEMKLIQGLSKLLSTLEKMDSESTTEIKPNEIRQSLVEAISPLIKNEEVKVVSSETVDSDQQKPIILTSGDVSAHSEQPSDSKSNLKPEVQTQAQVQTPAQTQQNLSTLQSNTNTMTNNTDVTVRQAEVDGDVVVEGPSVGTHQLNMKQSNSLISQPVQVSPQMRADVFNQILEAVKGQIRLSEHGTAMVVKLQPEQLGNVELKLNIQKGVVLAEIKVENEIVKATIESNLDNLKQSLSDKGYEVNQINVQVDSGKKENQQALNFDGQQRRNKQSNASEDNVQKDVIVPITRYELNELDGSTINIYG